MAVMTMSVYTALKKRKVYEDRMNKITGTTDDFISSVINIGALNPEELEKQQNQLKSNFDKKSTLIRNYTAINAAISQSNATTMIMVAGKEYTVTTAISRYAHLAFEIDFLNQIKKNVVRVVANVKKTNEQKMSEENIVAFVKAMMSNLPESMFNSENPDQNDETRTKYEDKYREEYITRNTASIIDPYGLVDKIDGMIEELEGFKADFNEALNISNIQTIIEVELDEE